MLKILVLLITIMGSISGEDIMTLEQIRTHLISKLEKQSNNFKFIKWDDQYSFSGKINNVSISISIENKIKEYQKRQDISIFDEFANQIMAIGKENDVLMKDRTKIYMQLQPHDIEINDYIGFKYSDQTIAMAIYYDEQRGALTYITSDMASKENMTKEQVLELSKRNADNLVAALHIEENKTDFGILYNVNTKAPFLKSSILIADSFLEKVKQKIKHPNFIISNRDCLYIFDSDNVELRNRLGSVCVKEYNNREYPVSCELFDVVDGKVKAIGAFQKKKTLPNK